MERAPASYSLDSLLFPMFLCYGCKPFEMTKCQLQCWERPLLGHDKKPRRVFSRCTLYLQLMTIVWCSVPDRTDSYSRNRNGPSHDIPVIWWGSCASCHCNIKRWWTRYSVTSRSGTRLFNHKTHEALHWTWHSDHQQIIWGMHVCVFKSHLLN